MAAVISGNGLGLFNSSLGQTGLGLGSSARLGAQGQDRQYVNVANGNLVLHSQDEQLLFRGMSLGQFRTYNSQGLASQVGSDGWLTGFERRVELLSGTLNAEGSVMRLHTGDGSFQDFAYVSANTYRSTTGDGAHDTLTWTSGAKTWTYVEGTTRREELYADHANATLKGRLTRIRDLTTDGTSPTGWDVLYDGQGRISQIRTKDTTAGGTPDAFVFAYDANGRLATLSTRENGLLLGQVNYGYDSVGRLASVLVDLTPQDGTGDRDVWDATVAANNDGYLFRTVYTYADASSLRISQVRQSDGTLVSYGYDAQGRVVSLTRGDTNADDTDGVGQTVTFSYDTTLRRTDVSDASGRTWTYGYDAAGHLTSVESPAIDGQRDVTTYAYDADGNLTGVVSQRGGVTLRRSDFQYDANGNLIWQWDVVDPATSPAASAIHRTYNAGNQLATETRYSGMDADGVGIDSTPSGGVTTQYVYDAQNRVTFVVSGAGEVTQMSYATSGSGIGQLESTRRYLGEAFSGTADAAALTAWATLARRAQSSLTTYQYDLRGRPSGSREFDQVDSTGSGVVTDSTRILEYVYDAQGLLRQQIVTRNPQGRGTSLGEFREITAYVYDGMGRLLSEVVQTQETVSSFTTVNTLSTSSWSYQDSGSTIRSIIEGGMAGDGTANDLVRHEVRDAAGMLVSVSESVLGDASQLRTTHHYYDASGLLRASEDANGARTYYFYDAEGALEAQVDAVGAVTEYVRDAIGRVVTSKAYATRVSTAGWLVAGQVVPDDAATIRPAAHAEDRTSGATYDALGRLLSQTDGEGGITRYVYDATGRLLEARSTDALGTAATARSTRYFYDAAGREIARLDPEGYLTQKQYDVGGRLIGTISYATATIEAQRASGSLDDLRPVASQGDATTRMFYDGRGNLVGQLDAEGYFTEFVYDEARNQRAVKAYGLQLVAADPAASFSALRTAAQAGEYRETRRSYDAMGQLKLESNPSGTVTRFTYDAQGRLVRTESAFGTSEVRENNQRFDAFGNLIGELGGEGSAHLTPGMSESQLDAVYAQYGVRHAYDALGRRIESVDALGNRTWYFYDAVGRLTQTVHGVQNEQGVQNAAGEVEEIRYDAFGQQRETIAYTGRIAIGEPFGREQAAAAVQVLQYVASIDSRQQLRYDRRGLLVERQDAEGFRASFQYDAFGSLVREEVQRNATQSRVTTYTYDRLGQLTGQVEDADGLARTTSAQHDAFGRVTSATDERGIVTSFGYDRLGRQLTTQRTLNGVLESSLVAYDAYSRVVSRTDALGRTTTFVHDDQAMSVTMTTPEGLQVVTRQDRHGQTVEVRNGKGYSKTYTYDLDGRLTHEGVMGSNDDYGFSGSFNDYGYSQFETETSYQYDVRGLLVKQEDGGGVVVEYTYDARGRLSETREGDALQPTRYSYDGQGRKIAVVDPSGVETHFAYDLDGRLVQSSVNPAGLNLTTLYTWDGLGNQLTVTEGAGSASERTVVYAYDGLGRRTSETVASGSLDLTTTYRYDISGNLVARIDPEQNVTRYTYDEANRLVFTVDATGAVAQTRYDVAGQVVATRRYAARIALSGLGEAVSEADVRSRLVRDDSHDVQQYLVYDLDGRQTHSIDGVGALTRYYYNVDGKVAQTYRYANALDLGSIRSGLESGLYEPADLNVLAITDSDRDVVVSHFYDASGQLRYTFDADRSVVEYRYDGGGRLIEKWQHNYQPDMGNPHVSAREDSIDAYYIQDRMYDQEDARYTGYVYDDAGRLAFTLTYVEPYGYSETDGWYHGAMMSVQGNEYDAAGRLTSSIAYGSWVEGYVPTFARGAPGYWPELKTVEDVFNAMRWSGSSDEMPQRRTDYFHDAAGRLQFTVSPTGAVEERRYDAVGNVREVRAYGEAINLDDWNYDVAAAVADQTDVRVTLQDFDDAGRLLSRTDALGNTEGWEYDGNGLLIAYTDKNQATWTYEYNAAGQRTTETSPLVIVSEVQPDGSVTQVARAIVTRTEYDAHGNVTRRIEDADGAARVTRYEYDNRGNQIRTIFPDAGLWNGSAFVPTNQQATIEVTYDALGRAVMQKDVRGNYSYKAYGPSDELLFEVDQEGYVTAYAYNTFGDQELLTRYATSIDVAAGTVLDASAIQARIVRRDDQDRHINTQYDLAGRKSLVTQPLYDGNPDTGYTWGQTSAFEYDMYGDLVTERTLVANEYYHYWIGAYPYDSYAVWTDLHHAYNELGQRIYTRDADRHVTTWRYSVRGELLEQIEYARRLPEFFSASLSTEDLIIPPPGDEETGFDRVTVWQYDVLGRKVSELSMRGDPSLEQGVHTQTQYDAAGRVTTVAVNGQETLSTYDVFGRVTSVRESERSVVRDDSDGLLNTVGRDLQSAALYRQVSPYSTMAYDAFGNVVRLHQYANGIEAGQTAVESSRDVVNITRYDLQGRAVWERDASGTEHTKTYDAADNLLSTTYRLDGNSGRWASVTHLATYDKVGHQVTSRVVRSLHDGQPAPVDSEDSSSVARYNAFGEIIAKDTLANAGLATSALAAQYQYDTNGRLVATNAEGGVWKHYAYDMRGGQIAQWHTMRDSQGNAITVETRMELDHHGNVVTQYLPSNDDSVNGVATIRKTYDRWGNVLSVTDALGATTDYRYNQLNQAIEEKKAEVLVVGADGSKQRTRPVSSWEYDDFGRLLASVDANGNRHESGYDAAGRMLYSEDASDNRTLFAYDVFGQKRYTQNPLGYLTYVDYDRAGRVVAQGDYLRNEDGLTRTRYARERYTLNQNGDRLSVTDALGYVSTYDYDSRGLVVRSRTAAGVAMEYAYDGNGNKTRETNALSLPSLATDGSPVYQGGLIENQIVVAGQLFQYTIPSDAFVIGGGEVPQYSVEVSFWDSSLGIYRTVEGFSIDPATRLVSGVPTQTGQYLIKVVARSSTGGRTEASTGVSAVSQASYDQYFANAPRAVAGLRDQSVVPGVSFSYQIPPGLVVDPQGQGITYSAHVNVERTEFDNEEKKYYTDYQSIALGTSAGAHWLMFDPATGTLSGTATGVGVVEVQIVATDAEGKSITLTMRVNASHANGRRTVVDDENETLKLDEQTWGYDFFGRLVDHNDLSGADYDYSYDTETGQLIGQNSDWTEAARRYSTPVTDRWYSKDWEQYGLDGLTGLDLPDSVLVNDPARQFSYYKSGLLKRMSEGENWFRYEYDAAGNRTVEEAYTHDADGQLLHVITYVTYDEHGRIAEVTQRDMTQDRGLLNLVYAYDAVGNRRYVLARTAYDPNAMGIDINGITNPDFEHGDYGWVLGEGWSIVEGGEGDSTLQAQYNKNGGTSIILNKQRVQVSADEIITASVRVEQGASSAGQAGASVIIQWYDAAGNELTVSQGNLVDDAGGGARYDSRITAKVPPGAVFMSVGAVAFRVSGDDPLWIDDFSWGAMPANAHLEDDSGWEWSGNGFSRSNNYDGSLQWNLTGEGRIMNTTRVAVRSGTRVNARANVQQGASSVGEAWGAVVLRFYDAGGSVISEVMGNRVDDGSGGAWHWSDISVTVPPGAVSMGIGAAAGRTGGSDPLWMDEFSWNYERDGDLDPTYEYVDPDPNDAYNSNEPHKAYWYDYDAENRVKVANGKLENGQIVLGSADVSYALDYDEAGRATRRRFLQGLTEVEEVTQYDERGQRLRVYQARALGSSDQVLKEKYAYDAVGRVTERRDYFDAGEVRNGVNITGWLKHAETFSYDADGRVLRQDIKGRMLGWTATTVPGNAAYEMSELGALSSLAAVDYSAYGYDDAGRLAGYAYHYWQHEDGSGALAGDPKDYTHSYIYQYEAREGYLEARVFGHSSNTNFRASTSYSSYDAWGRRVAVREQTPLSSNLGQLDDRIRYFSYDGQGNIVRRREGSLENGVFTQRPSQELQTQLYAYVGGSLVASGKHTGEVDLVGRMTAYQSNDSAGSQRTTVLAGETLRSVAQRVYGNASLWYVLAEANALLDEGSVTAGTTLLVPEVKVTANDSTTFKPFNPAEAIGNTAPSMPYIEPPPKEHCNGLAMVLIVVVAVAAAVMTGGAILAALPTAGTLGFTTAATIGAIAGTAGALAGQVAGSVMGVSSFSWRNVAAGAITGAITGGVGELLGTAGTAAGAIADTGKEVANTFSYGRAAAMALTSAGANYAGQKIAGVDVSFSWKSIAASAMSGFASARVGFTPNGNTSFTRDMTAGLTGGVVSAATRRVMGVGNGMDYATIAADAFGNALGNAIGRSALSGGNQPAGQEQPEDDRLEQLNAKAAASVSQLKTIDQIKSDLVAQGMTPTPENIRRAAIEAGGYSAADMAAAAAMDEQLSKLGQGFPRASMHDVATLGAEGAWDINRLQGMQTLEYALYVNQKYGADLPLPAVNSSIETLAYLNDNFIRPYVDAGVEHAQAIQAASQLRLEVDLAQQADARQLSTVDALRAGGGGTFYTGWLGAKQLYFNAVNDTYNAGRVAEELAEHNRVMENLKTGRPAAVWGGFIADAAQVPLAVGTAGRFGGSTVISRITMGAVTGGASELLAPVDGPASEYWARKGEQVGTGAVFGGVLAGAAAAPYAWRLGKNAWAARGGVLDRMFNGPSLGGYRTQIGTIGDVPNAMRQTGAGGIGEAADAAYAAIRASGDDVLAIAGNTGIKPVNVQKVKDHLFYNEHFLDRYERLGVPGEMKRFDSNTDIAESWKRLESGAHTPADMQLLRHETAEAWYMRRHGPSYNQSHNAAQRRFPSPFE